MSHDPDDKTPAPNLSGLGKANLRGTPEGYRLAIYVKANPETALQLIFDNGVAHLPIALDNVIDSIGDDAVAKEKINEYLPLADQASILAAWGEQPSGISWIAAPEVIAAAVRAMCEDERESGPSFAAAIVRGLAVQLHERADWDEVLEAEIGDFTLQDLLIASVAAEVPQTSDDEPRPRDAWILVGLDPDDAEERLPLLNPDLLILVTKSDIFEAKRKLAEKRAKAGLAKEKQGDGGDA